MASVNSTFVFSTIHLTQYFTKFFTQRLQFYVSYFFSSFLSSSRASLLCPSGVSKVEINMDAQRVYVTSTLSGQELLEVLKKTGRECRYIGVKS